jgi:OmpR-family two-component system manganese-sensing sensor histidine kinase
VIERLTRRLGQLVDDLLFLARQESGLMALVPASVDLAGLLEEVLEEQQVIAAERGIELHLERVMDSSAQRDRPSSQTTTIATLERHRDWIVVGDVSQLTRLFTNLISNAMQYTAKRGTVTVQLKLTKHQAHPWLQVTVQDTGIGMDTEAVAHAFDRFYRADPARLRSGDQGTGLGLAIAKAIVENHRGHIHINSQPGQGTQVVVLLPLSSGSSQKSQIITTY